MTNEQLEQILADHKLWIEGKGGIRAYLTDAVLRRAELSFADLTRADLTEAILIGADLTDAVLARADLTDAYLDGCIGNGREIKSMQLGGWPITYTADRLQIGCQSHAINKWRKWNTEAGRKWLDAMDKSATEWADTYLDHVLETIDMSPATPTGHEEEVK
jgi:uncharacterized protein YjbI with pentapeptide repeats